MGRGTGNIGIGNTERIKRRGAIGRIEDVSSRGNDGDDG